MPKRERGSGGLFRMKGSKNWYAQYYDAKGRPCRVTTGTDNKQEAIGILRNLMSDRDRGVAFIGDVKKLNYGDLRAALIHNYIERGNKSLQTTVDGTETIWGLSPLDDFFGYNSDKEPGVSVTKITTDAAREFARKRLDEGVTNSTINTSLAALRRMLNIAREDGKIQFVPKIHLLKPNPARKGFLPKAKFDELLGHVPLHLKPLILLLYYCGLRVGEALQIQWSQVDLETAIIRLEDEQTKSGEARTVPLPDVLVNILEQVEPKTGTVFDGTGLRNEWPKACAAAGLAGGRHGGLIIHDLRRSAIKNLMKAGTSEKVAMTISGHKTRSVFDRYHIVDEEDVIEAMRKVQALAVPVVAPVKAGKKSSESSVRVVGGQKRLKMLKSP
jgi:integrase